MLSIEHASDGVCVITLAHGKANALDIELCRELSDRVAEAGEESRAIVLTGRGPCFSAGVDLKRLLAEGDEYTREFLQELRRTFRELFRVSIPLVAAVNGHAIAGGCIMACAADLRIMNTGGGRIGPPELLVGVPFPALALEILRFATRGDRLQDLLYQGRALAGREALDAGLVDSLEDRDQLLEAACEAARRLARIPATSFRLTKARLRSPVLEAVDSAGGRDYDRQVDACWVSQETRSRIESYVRETLGDS